jgi:transposase InsO family protein
MEGNLKGTSKLPYVKKAYRSPPEPLLHVDIAGIYAISVHNHLKRAENEAFITSLYEIDRILDDRYQEERLQAKGLSQNELLAKAAGRWQPELLEISESSPPALTMPLAYAEFSDVASKEASNVLPPHRTYDHKIQLEGTNTLGYSPLYKMTTAELDETKRYLLDNLHKRFIEPSQSPFAAPILFVKKADGSLRFCIDYRKLNELTRKDRYPLPLIDEVLARIGQAKVFTKLDIRQAFHRIRMDPDSEELTTFRTRYGSYKCKVLPFGLTNGPATYQRYMNDVLFDYLDDFCTAYLDDILIYSENALEHELHVKKVLQRLRDAGLQVDLKKCEFSVTRTKYLGFIISTDGIEVDPEKVSAVVNWEAPVNVRGIQSFLGFCNFYRRFIQDYGRIAKPLVRLTKSGVPFQFDRACWDAFEELKSRLTTAPVLRHYNADYECMIETDASDGVIAGIFSQLHPDGEWHPVAYFSKTMAPAECNYEIHDKEMLAIVKSLDEWRPELQGTHSRIKIYTDHRALEYFMTTKRLTARQARWAEALSQYYFLIMYRAGKENAQADALTIRDEEIEAQNGVKDEYRTRAFLSQDQVDARVLQDLGINAIEEELLTEIAPLDESLELTDRILQANRESPSLDALRAQASAESGEFTLEEGLLLYSGRLVLPAGSVLVTDLIKEAHTQVSTAHPGRDKTYHLLRPRYYWPRMKADIDQYIRNCHTCQRAHVWRDRAPGYLHPLPVPQRPWQHITMDFKSAPKDKHGYDNIFVIVDRLTKQSISLPCHKEINAEGMARLFARHVYCYYGAPESIVSDRGPQFVSRFWKEFCRILGTKVSISTAGHPQTDGQTEIMNQYLDQRLRPFVNYYQDNWSELLPMMDYAQLTLPHSSLGMMSPFELLNGYPPRASFDWTPCKTTG